ncbi:thymidine kinase [Candidatus Babeliales bacterium]|nr:thymidine kinase [Candidatus Babeliales bacterium]
MQGAKDLRSVQKKGRLEVICGSMFSGKSEELMRRLRRAEYAKQRVLSLANKIDDRRGIGKISTHNGTVRIAHTLDNTIESIARMLILAEQADIVGIDEIHFFNEDIILAIRELVERGKHVLIAGLDQDFRGEPFNITAILMSLADNVTKLKAICLSCGRDAHHSQRLIDGKPARYDDPIILVGAQECYEARCRDCFSIDKRPWRTTTKTQQQQS